VIRAEGNSSLTDPVARADRGAAGEGTLANSDGDLVVVQQNVLATVDHAFGNIFQRLYHLARTMRAASAPALSPLEDSIRELQALLELFVDYVAPIAIEGRAMRAADVAASFRHHLDEAVGAGQLNVTLATELSAAVVVDPARLARVFHLLAQSLHESLDHGTSSVSVGVGVGGAHFEIVVGDFAPCNSPTAQLRWALAEKLVNLQAGELLETSAGEHRRWTLRLPVVA
jgi:hypothetical protein